MLIWEILIFGKAVTTFMLIKGKYIVLRMPPVETEGGWKMLEDQCNPGGIEGNQQRMQASLWLSRTATLESELGYQTW